MDGIIEIQSVNQIASLSNALGNIYFLISAVHGDLIRDHEVIRQCWVDQKVEEFSSHFETASDYLWQLLISISNMQEFLEYAAEGYSSADNQVSKL